MPHRHQPATPESLERLRILKKASWAGIIGNVLLSGLKISAGIISGSLAVVGDGVESLGDVVTSIVTLYAARAGSEPPDAEHPWGHGRMETIATKTLSLIIIMAGLQLLIMTVRRYLSADIAEGPGSLALWATGISIVGKVLLMVYKRRAGEKADSRMMLADAINMRNDIVLSFTVLAGLFFTRVLNMPIIDLAAGFVVSLWIIRTGVREFLHTTTELMDSVDDKEVYREVFASVEATDGVSNPHRVRIRGLNSLYVIELDVEVDSTLTVIEAHELACSLEEEIRKRVRKVFDIMVHVEPAGGREHREGYGLVPEDVEQ